MSFPLRCIAKQALGYITHEATTLSRVRFSVRQFAGKNNYRSTLLSRRKEVTSHSGSYQSFSILVFPSIRVAHLRALVLETYLTDHLRCPERRFTSPLESTLCKQNVVVPQDKTYLTPSNNYGGYSV